MDDVPVTIAQLKTGDRVRDSHGTVGSVTSFQRDRVFIEIAGMNHGFTDEELAAHGIVRVSPFVDEETRPE